MPEAMTTYPDEMWLTRLIRGNLVFLAKEGGFAEVEDRFFENEPYTSHHFGQIIIRRLGDTHGHVWLVRSNGRGNDNSQCLLPVVGQLPRELRSNDLQSRLESLQRQNELSGQILRSLSTSIQNLERRVGALELLTARDATASAATAADLQAMFDIPTNVAPVDAMMDVAMIPDDEPFTRVPFMGFTRPIRLAPQPEAPTAWDRISGEDKDAEEG